MVRTASLASWLTSLGLIVAVGSGCGRTGLDTFADGALPSLDGGSDGPGFDGGPDAGFDAGPDAGFDGGRCTRDLDCDDGLFCNGQERCVAGRCVAGAPIGCDDGNPCTVNTCDNRTRSCDTTIRDRDGDGAADALCGGTDCNDMNARVHPGAREVCDNGIDDDCNGLLDCANPVCARDPTCAMCLPRETNCSDGRDEDCDGLTDCADPDCAFDPACRMCAPRETNCSDGRDEDCDGLTDCADPDCAFDPACRMCAPRETNCSDGRDEDCDGLTDCADPDCAFDPACRMCAPRETNCSDGRDEDCDGLTDCADPDCAMDPACLSTCPDQDLGRRVGARVASGTTSGAGNHFVPSCVSGSTASDLSFAWRAPSTGTWVFDTFGSTYDTVLYVKTSCTGGELPGACDDDTSRGLQSQVTVSLRGGTRVVVVVDGWASSSGPYVLNIHRQLGTEAGHCANGVDDDGDGLIDCADPDCTGDPACGMCLPREVNCTDGRDEDCDGLVDCADPDCAMDPACMTCVPFEVNCTDGRDEDCDGLTDCADPDCAGDPACMVCSFREVNSHQRSGRRLRRARGLCGPGLCTRPLVQGVLAARGELLGRSGRRLRRARGLRGPGLRELHVVLPAGARGLQQRPGRRLRRARGLRGSELRHRSGVLHPVPRGVQQRP